MDDAEYVYGEFVDDGSAVAVCGAYADGADGEWVAGFESLIE